MVSISSAIASVAFSKKFLEKSLLDDNLENLSSKTVLGSNAYFDARAFNMPKEEIANYFIWRQKDWERNSIQMLARSMYSQKELTGKKIPEIHDMIHDKGDNWANLPDALKNGRLIERVDGKFQVLDVC
jgi:tRNA(His) 5'-end guanylyltransferase